jgi:hypothetical protein
MVKIKIYAIGNEENFNFYIFDKKQEVAKIISQITKKIFNATWRFMNEHQNKNGEWIEEVINIEGYTDIHQRISQNNKNKINSRIDVFYGDKKMFITINCSQEERLAFNKELLKIAEIPKTTK